MILLDILGFDVTGWLSGVGITGITGIIVMFLRKRGYMMSIKFWSKKIAVITQKAGHILLEASDVFSAMDKAIKENGKLKENSIKEIIKEGKEVILELKNAWVIVKPKK